MASDAQIQSEQGTEVGRRSLEVSHAQSNRCQVGAGRRGFESLQDLSEPAERAQSAALLQSERAGVLEAWLCSGQGSEVL